MHLSRVAAGSALRSAAESPRSGRGALNILAVTNTYKPCLGGVAESVNRFAERHRAAGHRVVVVAPTFDGMPDAEDDVLRVPSIRNFAGSRFSVRIPVPGVVTEGLRGFRPDIVHSHHPFLLGDCAWRLASTYGVPLVYTHHTMFESYTHHVSVETPALRRFVVGLSTTYANLSDRVVAPGSGVASILRDRGVSSRIDVLPTGVELGPARAANRERGRRRVGAHDREVVVGYVGRLSAEKNLRFLIASVSRYLTRNERALFLVVGDGDESERLREDARALRVADRVRFTGALRGEALWDAFAAMDVFAFASRSETQGMVLLEAMAVGAPVVALRARGVEDVVDDGANGLLVDDESEDDFATALGELVERVRADASTRRAALETARAHSMEAQSSLLLHIYDETRRRREAHDPDDSRWRRRLEAEWAIWSSRLRATARALSAPLS